MYNQVREKLVNDAKAEALQDLNLVHWMLKQQELFKNLADVQQWVKGISDSQGYRITYIDETGKVIVDSQFSFEAISQLDNFGTRPEILQARKGIVGVLIRLSTLTQREHIFVAKQVEPSGALPPGILRLAVPFWEMNRALDLLTRGLKVVVILSFAGMLLAVLIWRRELRKPLRGVMEAMDKIGTLKFGDVLRFPSQHELQPLANSVNHMNREIKERFRIIEDEKEQLEAVLEGMQEGVMVLDARGRIQRINRSLSKIATRAPITIGRQPMEVFMSYEIQEACERLLADTDQSATQRVNLQVELERERTYDVNIVKFREPNGGFVLIVVFHNISQLKRLEKVRQDFVANVSHELRTPLTSIKGYTETLLGDAEFTKESAASFLQIILKNTNHMVMIVDDLLQLARLEARDQQIELQPINVLDALTAAWKSCAPLAAAGKSVLENLLPREGVFVYGDMSRLVQVFRNLLENAIKFSPDGATVSVSCEEGDTMVTLRVKDNGVGIPMAHQQRIFERFYRIEKHRDRESGSTGLGLAICRHIVLNHGGQVWVQSPNPGEMTGTTFFFTLRRAPEPSDHGDSRHELPPSDLQAGG
jgi:two-component system phosphate regulon sensor histidine kinase PhoR